MMGKGWGLWVVGKKEKGRMKKKKKKDEETFGLVFIIVPF